MYVCYIHICYVHISRFIFTSAVRMLRSHLCVCDVSPLVCVQMCSACDHVCACVRVCVCSLACDRACACVCICECACVRVCVHACCLVSVCVFQRRHFILTTASLRPRRLLLPEVQSALCLRPGQRLVPVPWRCCSRSARWWLDTRCFSRRSASKHVCRHDCTQI